MKNHSCLYDANNLAGYWPQKARNEWRWSNIMYCGYSHMLQNTIPILSSPEHKADIQSRPRQNDQTF